MAVSACRNGCSHCCHIPVTISEIEAGMIGQRTGLKPARPAKSVRLADFDDLDLAEEALGELKKRPFAPCPFLKDGACSVYDIRPMVCRLLINLDDDDLLCRLVPEGNIPVPHANAHKLQALFMMAQPSALLADIRDFFPA